MWIDLNQDGKKDLIVASEWQPLKAYLTDGPLFKDASAQWFQFASNGWWNCIAHGDFDMDGDIDLIVGNYGLNSPLQADEQHPVQLYYMDVDVNGSTDPIMTHYIGNESVPLPMRDDLIGQIPMMKKKFNDYETYAKASIHDVFTKDQLAKSPLLLTNNLETIYLENNGKMFVKKVLPLEVQYSSVYAMVVSDLNNDGHTDVVMTGNNSLNRIYLGKQDANHGVVLLGDEKGNFHYISQLRSGLNVRGDVRSMLIESNALFIGLNNAPVKRYNIN